MKKYLRIVIFGLVSLLAASFPAMAQEAEIISFTGQQKGRAVQVTASVYWPSATGRVPALVLHHGSSGVNSGLFTMAKRYAASGVATVVIDSFKPRGVGTTVQDQNAVTREDFNLDALALLRVLANHPRIDPTRIGIAGFSKGAGSTLASALLADRAAAGVPAGTKYAFHVAFYPSCAVQPYRPQTTGAPMLMLLGGADIYVGAEPCKAYGDALRSAGANIVVRVFPEAPHAYDGDQAGSDPRGQNTSQCVFQQQANGSWVERKTGVLVAGPDGRWNTAAETKAMAGCRTTGVSWGPNAEARRLAHTELREYVQRYLLSR